MAPSKKAPSPQTNYTSPMDPDHEAKLKAEARAYALSSSSSSSKGSKRKSPPAAQTVAPKNSPTRPDTSTSTSTHKPTSLSIHRPDRPHKLHKPNPRNSPSHAHSLTPPATTSVFSGVFSENDDDYERFVKSLGLDDSLFATLDNDDEEFHLSDIEEDDDDDDDDDVNDINDDMRFNDYVGSSSLPSGPTTEAVESTPPLSSPLSSSPMMLPDFDTSLYDDLEEELGSLLEEDMEAAVQSLMTSKKPTAPSPNHTRKTTSPTTPKTSGKNQPKKTVDDTGESPATPLRETARQGTRTQVTYQQSQHLRRFLTRHYQLLVQQSILAVRAAQMQKLHKDKSDFLSGESSDDLAEILDGAVGMLQDLDQNRKDAIRNSIQLAQNTSRDGIELKGRRSLLPRFAESSETSNERAIKDRPLTRAAFSKTLEDQALNGAKRTAFDIPGLMKLKETFVTIDKSVEGVKGSSHILEMHSHADACKLVLRQAAANIDESFIPGLKDLAENVCDPQEVFGPSFCLPSSEEQETYFRRNRNLFTSGEDNLVLRGVNLYGEKQWILIADRYLPDRSVNIISQRYSKLCVMLYKANGINIDSKGNLDEPPKLESVDDIDEEKVKKLELGTVEPPAILNVHRWSLEEDLTLLKAVPIMGHMWAELGARLVPHRDRGHLRKRYQVLERRVKATVARSTKSDSSLFKIPRQQAFSRKPASPAMQTKTSQVKSAPKPFSGRAATKKAIPRKNTAAVPKTRAPPMSIEKAAASLAFLRPPRKKSQEINKSNSVSKEKTQKKNPVVNPSEPTKKTPLSKHASTNSPGAHSITPIAAIIPITTPSKSSGFKAHLNTEPSSSRAAFESLLVDGASEDWSQMSRMKRMMENDAESQAADAIVSHLAKSPSRSTCISTLPQIHLDSNLSGISILRSEASRQAGTKNENKPTKKSDPSIMARVLERAGKSSVLDSNLQNKSPTPYNDQSRTMESPRKRPLKSGSIPAPPSTPKRTNFFSTSGTPIGLSPGFRASPGVLRNSGSITLTPNVTYSPAASTVMRLMSEPSGDELRFCDFQISEESRKELEGAPDEHKHDPTPPPLTPSKNSLMLDDLEAISALNSLSNSPFRPTKKSGNADQNSKSEKKSLFATVVGGTNGKDPKTRLQF